MYGFDVIKVKLAADVTAPAQTIADLIETGKLKYTKEAGFRATYQDPCFLGKQNKIFDAPRNILRAVPGLELLEFTGSRENSLCCEGGGGRMFYEAETPYERNSVKRVAGAVDKGAEVLATSCPFCVMTLEDPATEKGLAVKDISEIVAEVL